jgi:3-oxoacyl-[acyl-carrier-protein] synthase-3
MSHSLHAVALAGSGSFLPGDPIPNDRIDEALGPLDGASEDVRRFMRTVGRRMLAHSGVEFRHFAVDPTTQTLTHTVAGMAEPACRAALEAAGRRPSDVELLLLTSPASDAQVPPTSTYLQERLGIERCAEMEVHSNCSGTGKCLQIAFDALRLGRYRNALIVAVQPAGSVLRSGYFNQSCVTKSQALLRYILSDGAGAVYLEATEENDTRPRVVGTYVDSVGGHRPAGMTCGWGIQDASLHYEPFRGTYEAGSHHLDQDFAAVNGEAGKTLTEGILGLLGSLDLAPLDIARYIVSFPTKQLYDRNVLHFAAHGVPLDRAQFRARDVGYLGCAAVLVHLDEALRAGELGPGDLAVVHAVESSKWMTAGFVVRG